MLPTLPPLDTLRDAIRLNLQQTLVDERRTPPTTFDEPPGDPGLFGPDSVTWRLHGDLPSMLVGGLAALMLQALHPLAMAGVAEHSAFREDPLGRLQRTAAFVGVTTFGSTEAAEQAMETVRRVHRFVKGTAPDGRPYDATDPDLLTWVHVAEVSSFLRAYRRYGPRPLSRADADRYVVEMTVVATGLGATDVPASVAEIHDYLAARRPELVAGSQALTALAFIVDGGSPTPVVGADPEQLVRGLLVQAALDLLPGWARRDYGVRQSFQLEREIVRAGTRSIFAVLRWALGTSEVLEAARARSLAPAPEPSRAPRRLVPV